MMPMRVLPLLLSSLIVLLSGCSTVAAWWSDDADDQASKSVAVSTDGPVITSASGDISVLWRNNVDQRKPASPFGFSLPAVIPTGHGELVVAGAQDGRLRIYRGTGAEVGRIDLHAACESGALQISNGLIVVGDVTGTIYGLDLSREKIVWQQQLSAALIGRPVAAGADFIVQTSNNQIYRFHPDGSKVWSYTGNIGGLGMHLQPSPVVKDGHVYAMFNNADLVALEAKNGSFMWKRQLLISNDAAVLSEMKVPVATPLIVAAADSGRDEDMIVVSVFQGELSFLSLHNGSTFSQRKLSLKSQPIRIGKLLLIADASGAVSALNAGNGETVWKQQVSTGELTGPILWQGNLWLADDQAHVFKLNQQGKVLASIQLDGRIDRRPVASAHGVLVRNSLGTLYMLR